MGAVQLDLFVDCVDVSPVVYNVTVEMINNGLNLALQDGVIYEWVDEWLTNERSSFKHKDWTYHDWLGIATNQGARSFWGDGREGQKSLTKFNPSHVGKVSYYDVALPKEEVYVHLQNVGAMLFSFALFPKTQIDYADAEDFINKTIMLEPPNIRTNEDIYNNMMQAHVDYGGKKRFKIAESRKHVEQAIVVSDDRIL